MTEDTGGLKNEEQQTEDNTAVINIVITVYNWRRLNAQKMPGESFNTVIQRLLDEKEATS